MTVEEIEFANNVVIDPIETLKEQLRILKVKELRIAKRMKAALDGEIESNQVDKDGKKKNPGIVHLTVSQTKTVTADGGKNETFSSTSETYAQNYLRLDQAHNMIQSQIIKAASLLRQMQTDAGEGDEPLPLYTLPPEEAGSDHE